MLPYRSINSGNLCLYSPNTIIPRPLFLLILTVVAATIPVATITMTTTNPNPSTKQIFVRGQADFSLDLLRQLIGIDTNKTNTKGNSTEYPSMVVSPQSLATALAMVMVGARGQTLIELRRSLIGIVGSGDGNGQDFATIEHLAPKQRQQQQNSTGSSTDITLNSANRIYVNPKVARLVSRYEALLREMFDGNSEELDFSQSEHAAEVINNFIGRATNGLIPKLVGADAFRGDPNSIGIVLVNAIYFRGNWAISFDESQTTLKPFFTAKDAPQKQLQTMHANNQRFHFFENEQVKLLKLFYQGGGKGEGDRHHNHQSLSMVFVLPKRRFQLAETIAQLRGSQVFIDWATEAEWSNEKVKVQLPKFKIESTHNHLKETLQALGVIKMFTPEAELSNLAQSPVGKSLFVSKVIQKAVIEVNEKGTEAAAATMITMYRSVSYKHTRPMEFIADEPFLYAILDADGRLLFTGVFNG